MPKPSPVSLFGAIALVLTACSSPEREADRNLEIPVAVDDVETFVEEHGDLIVRLGDAYKLLGFSLATTFGGRPDADTLTLGEIVQWVDEVEAREAEREAERARIAQEERERRDAFRREMEEVLEVVLVDKGFRPRNIRAGRYDDYITFEFAYENRGDVDIRGFRGTVHFMDLFADTILR